MIHDEIKKTLCGACGYMGDKECTWKVVGKVLENGYSEEQQDGWVKLTTCLTNSFPNVGPKNLFTSISEFLNISNAGESLFQNNF
jgi:hypothetical protein